jgi:hypothetical protein
MLDWIRIFTVLCVGASLQQFMGVNINTSPTALILAWLITSHIVYSAIDKTLFVFYFVVATVVRMAIVRVVGPNVYWRLFRN